MQSWHFPERSPSVGRSLGRTLLIAAALLGARAESTRAQTPVLNASPSFVTFAKPLAGGDPPAQAIVVNAIPATPVNALALASPVYEVLSGAPGTSGWLNATLDRTTTPAVIALRVNSAGISPGSYRATVKITGTGASQATLLVMFNVPQAKPNPRTPAASATVSFRPGDAPGTQSGTTGVVIDTDNPLLQAEGLSISGINYDIGIEGPWLTATLDRSVTPAILRLEGRRQFVNGGATTTLSTGYHRALVTIVSSDPAGPQWRVLVGLTVPSGGALAGTPSLSLTGGSGGSPANPIVNLSSIGGQGDPMPATLLVQNTNAANSYISGVTIGAITYGAGQPTGWLALSQEGADEGSVIVVHPDAGTLTPGTYTASFVVNAPGDAAAHTVTVNYTILDPTPVLTLSGSTNSVAHAFTVARGSADPAPMAVAIGNSAPGGTVRELSGLSLGTVSYGNGGSGWLDAELVDSRAATTLVLRPHLDTLRDGAYVAVVPINAPGAKGDQHTVTVNFTVWQSASPVLKLGQTTVTATSNFARAEEMSTVSIINAGGDTLDSLSVSRITYPGGSPTGWLRTSLSATTAPATLNIYAARGDLPGGTYTGQVEIRARNGALDSPQTINVTFTVPPRAVLAVAPASVNFAALEGEASPAAQSVRVTNAGQSTLGRLSLSTIRYGAGQPTGWLTGSLDSATAPASLTLRPTTGALPAGTYTAALDVHSAEPGVIGPMRVVTVTLTIGRPTMVLSRSAVTIIGNARETNFVERVQVTNGDMGTLSGLTLGSISYASGQPTGWLDVNLSATTAPAEILLTAKIGTMAAGKYSAKLPISASGGSPEIIEVAFVVPELPVLTLDTREVAFSATEGAMDPADQTVAVINGGVGTLDGLAVGKIDYGAPNAPAGWLTARLNQSVAPATLTLHASTATLAPGTYRAVVMIESSLPGARNNPQALTVTFTVHRRPPVIVTSTNAVMLSMAIDSGVKLPRQVAITDGSTTRITELTAAVVYEGNETGWLSASIASSQAPSTLLLTSAARRLTPGLHSATVTLSGTDAAPVQLRVTLEVIDLKAATSALLHETDLPTAERERLDALGNQDGTYNLGDYLALLKRVGVIQ